MRMDKGKPFMDVPADFAPDGCDRQPPVFSEAFLYPTVGKGDARFVLGVAEEYLSGSVPGSGSSFLRRRSSASIE